MSQRKLSSIETRGGGLDTVKTLAEQKGMHMLRLEDDKGEELIAASVKPFEVVCWWRCICFLRSKTIFSHSSVLRKEN